MKRHTKRKRKWGYEQAMLVTMGVAIGGLGAMYLTGNVPAVASQGDELTCSRARIIDGDTFDCSGTRIRMQGIDAPEMAGHCRPGRSCTPGDPIASTANLRQLTSGSTVTCRKTDTDAYGRTVARCYAGEVDLSCKQVEDGHAVKRYAPIWC